MVLLLSEGTNRGTMGTSWRPATLHCTYADPVTLSDRDLFTGGECPEAISGTTLKTFQRLYYYSHHRHHHLSHTSSPGAASWPWDWIIGFTLEVFLRILGIVSRFCNRSTQRHFKDFKFISLALPYNQDISRKLHHHDLYTFRHVHDKKWKILKLR